MFLDTLNDLFKREFKVVKTLFIDDFWKFGIVILKNSETNIAYSLFPIGREENQKQIIIDTSEEKDIVILSSKYINIRAFSGINPIISFPVRHAFERCWEYLKTLLDKKMLWLNNHYMEREYLFFIKDKYFRLTDNEPTTIDLIELKNQIETYLLIIPESEKLVMVNFFESNFNLYRALDYIQSLRLIGLKEVLRLTVSKQSIQNISIELAQTKLFPKIHKKNLSNFWSAFLESYENVIYQYFPDIANKIEYLSKNDKLIILPFVKTIPNSDIAIPYFMIYKLKGLNQQNSSRVFIEINPKAVKHNISLGAIIYKNKQYVNWERETIAISKFDNEMPLREFIYTELNKNMNVFFEKENLV